MRQDSIARSAWKAKSPVVGIERNDVDHRVRIQWPEKVRKRPVTGNRLEPQRRAQFLGIHKQQDKTCSASIESPGCFHHLSRKR